MACHDPLPINQQLNSREQPCSINSRTTVAPLTIGRDDGFKKKLWPLLWGEGYITAGDKVSRRAFVELVLRQLRRAFKIVTERERKPGPMAKLASRVGIRPPEGATGNAAVQGAMELWIPMADILLSALQSAVPSPMAPPFERSTPPPPILFYAVAIQTATDGTQYAVGRVCYDEAKLEACMDIVSQCGSGAIGSPAMFNARARDAKWVFLGTGQATRMSNGDAARAGAVLGLVLPRGLLGGGSLPMRIRLS